MINKLYKNKKHYFLLIGLALFSMQVVAQTTIQGVVVDNLTGENLPGANVVVEGTGKGSSTDLSGNFSITTDQELPVTLVVTYVGYVQASVSVSDASSSIRIGLDADDIITDEVVISASRQPEKIQEAPAAISVITSKKLQGLAASNPILALKNLTGVDIAQYGVGEGKINLRGKSTAFTTETFVITDYRNINIPSLGAMFYGQAPIDEIDLDRIEVIKGPGSALYGPGVQAGVVHFITLSPFKKQGLSVSLSAGNYDQLKGSFRYATVSDSKKVGFKLNGYYRKSSDFVMDDPAGLARLATYGSTITSSVTGDTFSLAADEVPNYSTSSYGVTGTLEVRPGDGSTVTGVLGYSTVEGIFRTGQGEGYTKLPRPFAQLRYQKGGLFAQAFWSQQNGEDNSWIYGTGLTNFNNIGQYEGQIQYNLAVADDKLDLTFGGDYRVNVTDSQGSIYGRYEDNDDYSVLGAYIQGKYKVAEKLDFIAAGRVDKLKAIDATAFSPRMALVYKADPNHTFRATYNKSIGLPSALQIYADLPVQVTPNFDVTLHGGSGPITFDDGNYYSFVTGTPLPGGNIPLNAAFGLVTSQFVGTGLEALIPYLNTLTPSIAGATSPTLTAAPLTRDPIEAPVSTTFEIGYIGKISDQFQITIDAYYNQRDKDLTSTVRASPLLVYPAAGDDLAAAVAAVADPTVLAGVGLNPTALGQIYKSALETQTLNADGSPAVLGLLSSDQSATGNTLDLSYYNVEQVDYYGLDVGLTYALNSDVTFNGSFSWLSQAYWEEVNIANRDTAIPFSLNVPELRYKFGVEYLPEKGFSANVSTRYRGEFESVNGGAWTGFNESSFLVDAGVGYNFGDYRVSFNAANLFDTEYRPIANAPFVRRVMMLKLTADLF